MNALYAGTRVRQENGKWWAGDYGDNTLKSFDSVYEAGKWADVLKARNKAIVRADKVHIILKDIAIEAQK